MNANIDYEKLRKQLNREQVDTYNCFVDALKGRLLTVFSMRISDDGGVFFFIDTEHGISKSEAEAMFSDFCKMFPKSGINHNLPREMTALEEELTRVSKTVFLIESGFKLEKL